MNGQRVRVVIGEGRSSQQGLLRFVLDGEGYDVVADAANPAELARVLATHKPDVVVLDDGIGATAVSMVHEMAPSAKVVLVWPGAVVPIGGAAQVPPSQVLQELGPAVAKVAGVAGAAAAITGAEMVDRTKRDPDALRRTLQGVGGISAATMAGEAIIDAREAAPVVILPVTPSVDDDVVTVPEAAPGAATAGAAGVATAGAATYGAQSVLNRRLGNLALGGAAVAGAIVLALALGGAKVPIAQVSGQTYTISPPAAPSPGESAQGDGPSNPGSTGEDRPGGGKDDGTQGGGDGGGGFGDLYPIQPALASFLPDPLAPLFAGGTQPSIETADGALDEPKRSARTADKAPRQRSGGKRKS